MALRRIRARAFTLVEMLTVIGILAILLAIIIPAINKARNAARRTDTAGQLNQLGDACQRYMIDKRRNPGYFNARLMGSTTNGNTNGFTNMQNLMLDLVGGVTKVSAGALTVGPGNAPPTAPQPEQVYVDLGAMGSVSQTGSGGTQNAYFTIDPKRFVAQKVADNKKAFAAVDNDSLPELVDTFGQPILAWVKNDIDTGTEFAAIDSGTPGAKFYWMPNSTLLSSTSLGRLAEDQRYVNSGTGTKSGSLLNNDNTPVNRLETMRAMLGSPSSADTAAPPGMPRPATARGSIVFHSGGENGVYVGVKERGGVTGIVNYLPGQDRFSGGAFDDVFAFSGQ